jgi:hypothetical protein
MNTTTRMIIATLSIIILVLVAVLIGTGRQYRDTQNTDPNVVTPIPPVSVGGGTGGGESGMEPIACTMDAHMCDDGSYVGRSGPNCEFVCPGTPVVDPIAPPKDPYSRYVASGCKVVEGCNGPITCVDEDVEIGGSICVALPEYACYKTSTPRCEKQASTNSCGWTPTPTLNACIDSARSSYQN